MPISDDEWDAGRTEESADANETNPVSEYESERHLVTAFLSENADNAYTRMEIVKGVDFGESEDPETVSEFLMGIDDKLTDLAGEVAASASVVDDVDPVLDKLVAEDVVAEKTIEGDGESVTYYRLNTGDSRD